jgi:hypothetical protein
MECEHIAALRKFLREQGLDLWSEHGEGGWVNVRCESCRRTYEVVLLEDRRT